MFNLKTFAIAGLAIFSAINFTNANAQVLNKNSNSNLNLNLNKTQITFAVSATTTAKNDIINARIFAENTADSTAELAKEINKKIEMLLNLAKTNYANKFKVKTGRQISQPLYNKNHTNIERWQMRSELEIEAKSSDINILAEFLGKAQQMNLAVGQISQNISVNQKTQIESQTTRDAVNLFKNRAEIIAETMNGKYKILQMTISQNNEYIQPVTFRKTANLAMSAVAEDAVNTPLEVGESEISTRVEGTIVVY